MAGRLGKYIDRLFGDLTLEQLASRTGVTVPALSRMKNGQAPSLRNALRVAAAAGVSPAKIHELAGQPAEAALYRSIFSDSDPPRSHRETRLIRDFERLVDTGGLDQLEDVLRRAQDERWGAMKKALARMADKFAASSTVMLLERGGRRRAVAWTCRDSQVEALELSPEDCQGWEWHRSGPGDVVWILGLKSPGRSVQVIIDSFLEVWSGSPIEG